MVGVADSSEDVFGGCNYTSHAVIWRDGETIDLGGIPPIDDTSGGRGINDNDDAVVGWGWIEVSGGYQSAPSYWNPIDGMSQITDGQDLGPK